MTNQEHDRGGGRNDERIRRQFAMYATLSQVGIEMVAPIVVGLVMDYYVGWGPWGAIVGAIVGFVGGFMHLLAILNRIEQDSRDK